MSLRAISLVAVLAAAPAAATPAVAAEPQEMTQAEVNDALFDAPEVYNGLLIASIVYHMTDVCDALRGPGRVARTMYFLDLYQSARALGFSRDQIERFVEDDQQQERMRRHVHAYAEQNGARPENRADICALGRAEMAEDSPVGRRLRER